VGKRGQRGGGHERAGNTHPDHRAGDLAEPPPADVHPTVEQDHRQRHRHHPLDGGHRHPAQRRYEIGGHRRGQQEDRRGGNPDAFADPVGQHRRGDGNGHGQHDQREVLDVAHRPAAYPAD
jgi:hypothetical protein